MESNEELSEKPTMKRRSSILKLPKPRYEDVDLTDTYTDITLSKPVRRVSFASSNFIKPFVADPEKNTIWDITYEEDVNHTNSTQSSQEQIVNNWTKIDSNFLESSSSLKARSNATDVTIWSEKDMELTKGALFDGKENIPVNPQRKISIVDYAKKLSSNSTAPFFHLPPNSCHSGFFEEVGNATKLYPQNMDITCQMPDNTVRQEEKMEKTVFSVYDSGDNDMELICYAPQMNDDMELSCLIPEKKSTNDIHQVLQNNFMKEGGATDFVGQVPQSGVFKTKNLNITTQISITNSPIDNNCQIPNNTLIKKAEMELTRQVPRREVNDGMGITYQIHTTKAVNDNNQIPNSTYGKEVDDMEFTCQVPLTNTSNKNSLCRDLQNNLGKDNHITFACHIGSKKATNDTGRVFQNNETKGTDDMEFTCQLPLINPSNKNSHCQDLQNNLGKDNNGMAFPCPMGSKKTTTDTGRVFQSNETKGTDDMEFTCQLPLINPSNKNSHCQDLQNDLGKDNNGIAFPCPMGSKKTTNDTGRVFQSYETKGTDDMEFTCQVPLTNTSNKNSHYEDVQNNLGKDNNGITFLCQMGSKKTTHDDIQVFQNNVMKGADDMEFTCQIPTTKTTNDSRSLVFKSEAIGKDQVSMAKAVTCQVSQSNFTKINNDMELTCQIPTTKIISSNVSCQDSQSNLTKMRGNTNFANMTKVVDDTEFTCQLPVMTNDTFTLVPRGNSTMMIDDREFSCQIHATKTTDDELAENETLNNKTKIIGKNSSSLINSPMEISYATDNETLIGSEPNQFFSNSKKVSSLGQSDAHMSVDKSSIVQVAHGAEEPFDNLKLSLTDTSYTASKLTPEKVAGSLIPTKKKFSIPPEPTSFKKQRMPFSERQEPPLDMTCQSPTVEALKSKLALSAQKLSNISKLKHDVSAPESSFHLNLTNISSGVDETQNLLQCTYSSKPAFISKLDDAEHISEPNLNHITDTVSLPNLEDTRFVCSNNLTNPTSFTVNLEGVRCIDNNYTVGIGLPKLDNTGYAVEDNLSDNFEQTTADASVFFDVQKNKLSSVNDTYVLRSKRSMVNSSTEAAEESDMGIEEDASLGIIPEECIETLDNDWRTPANNVTRTIKKFELQEFNYTIKRGSEVLDLQERISKQRGLIKEYLESFKCRPISCPKEFVVLEKSSLDLSASLGEISGEVFCAPSVEEKIRAHQESCQNCWKLEKVDGNVYHFSTLFGTLIFIVELNPESGKVTQIWKSSRLAANSKPISRYLMKLFLDKLSDGHMKSAIGDNYDALSLLDYIQMLMLRLDGFLRDFTTSDILSMEEDFVAKFKILSVPLVLSCDVLVDVADIDNLKCGENIKVVTDIGVVNESEIKKMAQNCPKGLDFFQSFLSAIQDYTAKLKEKKKRLDNIKK